MPLTNLHQNVCRTCLVEDSHMKSIFNSEEDESRVMLSELLTMFTSIKVAKGDGLPEQICFNCVEEINRIYLFQKLCKRSEFELRQYLCPMISSSLNIKSNFDIQPSLSDVKTITSSSKKCSLNELEEIEQESDVSLGDPNIYSFSFDTKVNSEAILNSSAPETGNKCDKKGAYHCKLCNKNYSELIAYQEHISFHSQLVKCDTCSKCFKSELMLTRHKLSHKTEDKNLIQTPKSKMKTGILKKRNLPRTCEPEKRELSK
ncbi:Zinc-finger associated domain (zf-AD) [Popillia japonica]|uniref:Zinc-finger associated domain (Zf-AD) n=1 Tax=Popillia japonica TaxID=7064 RepID=A0AAW1IB84_POPJA